MPRVRKLDPTVSPLHSFGAEIRRAREAAGMTLAEFGALVPCDASRVSRIEAGLLMPDVAFATAADHAFPQMGGWLGRFFDSQGNWDTAPYPPAFRNFVTDESEASALYVFEHSLIPGLLATEDYSRAVLSRHPNVGESAVSARVAARMARQTILDREVPPRLWAVIDDAVLSRRVGSAETMRDALRHLADMARRPTVTVQVLADAGAHVGLSSPCTIAEITGAVISVNIDDIADGRVIDDADTMSDIAAKFRWLQAEALSPSASLAMIEQRAEEWNNTTAPGVSRLTPVPTADSV